MDALNALPASAEPPRAEPNTTETDTLSPQGASTGCCGGPAPKQSNACCALDAEVKATGGSGCGCSQATTTKKKGCC